MKKNIIYLLLFVSFVLCGCQSRPKAPSFPAIVKMLRRSQKFTPDIDNKLWSRFGTYLESYGYDKIYFDSLPKSQIEYDFYPAVRMLYGYNLKYDKINDECIPIDSTYFGFYYVATGDLSGRPDTLYIVMSDSVTFNSYRMQAKEIGFDNSYPYYGKNHYFYRFPNWKFPGDWYTSYVMHCLYTKKCKYVFSIVGY